jgi:hypothetical protein
MFSIVEKLNKAFVEVFPEESLQEEIIAIISKPDFAHLLNELPAGLKTLSKRGYLEVNLNQGRVISVGVKRPTKTNTFKLTSKDGVEFYKFYYEQI